MSKIILEKKLWEFFPDAKIVAVTAYGINNSDEYSADSRDDLEELLYSSSVCAKDFFKSDIFGKNTVISAWRDVYKKMGANSSEGSPLEKLFRQIYSGRDIRPCDPLTDIYRAVSLTHALPCTAMDLECIDDDIILCPADGDESFQIRDSGDNVYPSRNELIYKDSSGALTRYWNMESADRSDITDSTEDAVMFIDSVDKSRNDDLEDAGWMLTNLIQKHLGGAVDFEILDPSNTSIDLEKIK